MVTPRGAEIARNGRPGLAHADRDRGGMRRPAGQGGDGDSFGQVLEQVDVRPGDDRGHGLR